MKLKRPDWVALPAAWIEEGGLRVFRWGVEGGRQTAALMTFIVVAHHADLDDGLAVATYDRIGLATGLSRSLIASALTQLIALELIERAPEHGRSAYQLMGFDRGAGGWAKLPVKGLYSGGVIPAFAHFHLRSKVELDALKLYLLFVARRDTKTNYAHLTFGQIEERCGVERARIRPALSLLAASNLVHIDHVKSAMSENGVANAYRLTYLESRTHLGTSGRASIDDLF